MFSEERVGSSSEKCSPEVLALQDQITSVEQVECVFLFRGWYVNDHSI